MNSYSIKILSLLLLLLGSSCLFKNPAPEKEVDMQKNLIPLEDFFRNPASSAYKLSPNGEYMAYLAPYENRKNIFVQDVAQEQAPLRLTKVTDRDLSGFFWANNDRLVYVRDQGGDENFHLFSVDRAGQKEVDLTPFDNVRVEIIDDLRSDEQHLIIGMNKRNPQVFDPYRLNIQTAELELLAENPGNITSWKTDHQGRLRLAIATDGVNSSLLYRKSEKDSFRLVLNTSFKETLYPLYFDFEGKEEIYALSDLGRDKTAVVKFDLKTAKETQLIFEHPEVNVSYMSYSRKRKALSSISYISWKREYHFLDPQVAAIYKHLESLLPDLEIVLSSTNEEENKFIVRTYSDRSLGAYYFYDLDQKELRKIAEVSPWLPSNQLAEMQPISYRSRDGWQIHGYLTLPKGKAPKNLPVVVNPHSGPWARDVWTFNPEVQFLANRGYAVLQVNFRGSTGYGRKFWEASFKEWGLKMQDDVSDGVDWLIREGIADPDRVAIYGGSYGGYCSLAGITFSPEKYACAIDYVGVSNLFTFMETIPPYWEPYRKMLHEMVGDPSNEADSIRMRASSPVFHVDKIKAPLLIAQGAKDPRVNQAESDQMVAALQARGVEVEYILKENEGHGFRNEENRFEFYGRMQSFLAKHLAKD